jgi:hypothetical protein
MRLVEHRADVFSQFGEDGIIRAILDRLPQVPEWCVEFGAWDGKRASNTHRLMVEEDWAGVFIEADPKRFRELEATYAGNDRAACVQAMVRPGDLDGILGCTSIPTHFGVLSIDVDGDDWHIWRGLSNYRPAVVVIEFNPTIPPDVDFVQPAGAHQGSSLRAFVRLGREKGYELAAVVGNAFFVRNDLFPALGIEDNSIEALHTDHSRETRVWQFYDGTLVWEGCTRLLRHDVDPGDVQPIPKWLRYLPGLEPNPILKWTRRLYVRLLRVLSWKARRDDA